MKYLEVSGSVRPLQSSLGVKGLSDKGAKINNYYLYYGNKINTSINFNFTFLLTLFFKKGIMSTRNLFSFRQ